jgi:hypothetical protein
MMNRDLAFLLGVGGAAVVLSGCVNPGWYAAGNCDAAQLQELLSKPNHGGAHLENLLDDAVTGDCIDCARELIQAGTKPSAKELVWAGTRGYEKISRLLIHGGADPVEALAMLPGVTGYSPELNQTVSELYKRAGSESKVAASNPVVGAPLAQGARLIPSFQNAERPDDYALIIGIEKYDDLPAATYAESDAKAAARFVQALGVPARNMVTLTGERATRSGLSKQLEGWLANNADGNSTVYFYYSGHGAPDPKNGQAYLVPIDGDPQYLTQTAYPLKRLYADLGALKARRVIVMLDSCFSGAGGRSVLAKGARPLVNNVDTGFNSGDGKIAVLAASGADQISGTDDDTGHGLFTQYLLEGLNGAAKNSSGQVTLKSLYNYLKPKVMDDAHRANRDQVPQLQMAGAASGDVILRRGIEDK